MMTLQETSSSHDTTAVLDLTAIDGSGPGWPTWRGHWVELRRALQLAGQGERHRAANRVRSVASNVWNFQLRGRRQSVECPCCGWRGPAFLSFSNWRAVQPNSGCPGCDSRSRHRGLALLLPDLLGDAPGGPYLIFAPERSLMTRLSALGAPIHTTDYLRTDVDFPGEDIQQLTFAGNSYAFLMCNHVLEHIPDDRAALRECARVLMPGGLAVFTIPGDYHKQETWTLPTPDANGHLRHYGLDVTDKMRAAGFSEVTAIDMSLGRPPHYHIHPGDTAFVCRK